nr:hypothetical protein [Vibrio vulnificus]
MKLVCRKLVYAALTP